MYNDMEHSLLIKFPVPLLYCTVTSCEPVESLQTQYKQRPRGQNGIVVPGRMVVKHSCYFFMIFLFPTLLLASDLPCMDQPLGLLRVATAIACIPVPAIICSCCCSSHGKSPATDLNRMTSSNVSAIVYL